MYNIGWYCVWWRFAAHTHEHITTQLDIMLNVNFMPALTSILIYMIQTTVTSTQYTLTYNFNQETLPCYVTVTFIFKAFQIVKEKNVKRKKKNFFFVFCHKLHESTLNHMKSDLSLRKPSNCAFSFIHIFALWFCLFLVVLWMISSKCATKIILN